MEQEHGVFVLFRSNQIKSALLFFVQRHGFVGAGLNRHDVAVTFREYHFDVAIFFQGFKNRRRCAGRFQ